MNSLTFDAKTVKEYFKFLGPSENTIQTVCFLDIKSIEVIKGWGVKFGTVNDIWEMCAQVKVPFTLHTCLNLTNLKGRRNENIAQVRVLCLDIDDVRSSDEIKGLVEAFKPGMVVESSPGKYHIYWKIHCNLEQWKIYQLGIGFKLRGDLNLDQLGKTIRVPGVIRECKDGSLFLPTIKYLDYSVGELEDVTVVNVFPWILSAYELGKEARKVNSSVTRLALKEARKSQRKGSVDTPIEGRNSSLFGEIREMVAEGEIGEGEVMEVAGEINGAFKEPLSENEVSKTAESAVKSGLAALAKKRERVEAQKRCLIPLEFDYDYEENLLLRDRFSDGAFASREIQKHGRRLFRNEEGVNMYDEYTKSWRKQKYAEDILQEMIADVCQDVINDPEFIEQCCLDSKGNFSEVLFKRERAKWLSASKQKSLIELLKRDPRIVRKDFQGFDTNPIYFHCHNYLTDLIDSSFRQAKAEDYLMKKANVIYDKEARCPGWEKFISEIFAENRAPKEMERYMQQVFGYTLTGHMGEQCIFIHSGNGANGKSRVLYALRVLMGDYAGVMEPNALSISSSAFAKEFNRFGIKFEGKRCIIIDDLNTKTQWDESLVKILTSEKLPGRPLYGEEREIANRAKVHIGCNSMPDVVEGGHAVFRRLRIINYPRTFKVDPIKYQEIETMIHSELSGIFNWAMAGLQYTMRETGGVIKPPEEVLWALEDYEGSSFDLSDVFEKLFTKPEDHEKDDHWKHANELTDIINGYLLTTGRRDKQVSVDKAGRVLSKYFVKDRRRVNGRLDNKKMTFYNIKLLSTRL